MFIVCIYAFIAVYIAMQIRVYYSCNTDLSYKYMYATMGT